MELNMPLTVEGSSPRVRGAAGRYQAVERLPGIIPARAGSSHARTASRRSPAGSSPRVRGADRHLGRAVRLDGIIPARAGSSSSCAAGPRRDRDHPRACGEQCSSSPPTPWHPGSSPRVRGADRHLGRAVRLDGIIPARAGSRATPRRSRVWARDHPRACGEQT